MKVHIDEIAKVGVAAKGVPSCELSSYTSYLDNVLLSNFLPLLLSLPDMSTASAVDIEAISFPVRFLSLSSCLTRSLDKLTVQGTWGLSTDGN